jgi:transposase
MELGLQIPNEIRIVGIDDVRYARLLPVPLTTQHQPCRDIGRVALAVMLERIGNPDVLTRDVLLGCKLIVRRSCGARISQSKNGDGNRPESSKPNVERQLEVHLVLDNYGTHKTKLIRNWLAKRPRFHVHFTPTSASWLNLVERWFALLTERQIRRGVHRSTKELETAIGSFIQPHNRDPKPFVWHKNADQILDSVARFCKRTLDSGH